MEGLKELILKEEKRLKRIKEIVDSRLADVPEGTLRVTTSKKNIQYIQCVENGTEQGYKLSYIKKKDMPLAYRLAQKSYDQKIKRLVDRRVKQLDKLVKEYEDNEVEEIYDKLHHIRKTMINPVEIPWEKRLAEWKSVPYVGKEFKPGMTEIYTKKGERVRSKSEKIMADTFYDLGIEYKYECPLKLKGYGVVYPDFTFLRKRDFKEVYWEHDGKMDDADYAEKAIRKINTYIANGIFPGDNLIVSFESSGVVINDKIIKQLISKYLL
ncbi:hypothetical protein [Butyrivibrio sp. M55]|uniref:hypothetical protein n=1 Tax=Butyrivibrio sp. M55 TaxID=1855323 RepID=UPI0008E9678A|nr:hypothetical protein [Butyrivibrio sp. M55]SFU83578.1 hypothetical protein SAMN05216540_1132 [Butyrivibrio sp. M55]